MKTRIKREDTMYRAGLLIALIIAVAAFGGGCGGGSGGANATAGDSQSTSSAAQSETASTTANGSPLSRAQFIKRANAICADSEARMLEKIQAYEKQQPQSANQTEAEKVAAVKSIVLVPVMQETIDGIRGLGVPPSNEKQVDIVLSAMQQENDSLEGHEISSFYEFGDAFQPSDKLAVKYGLKECTFSF
jgi:hypothetical protein